MTFFDYPSLVGLLIQAAGALLMATLGFVLLRTMRREPLLYWTVGWTALFIALLLLWLSFQIAAVGPIGQPLYIFGEYLFGYLVFAGCRRFASNIGISRRERWLLVPAVALAIVLPVLGGFDFNVFFAVHTLLYGYLFLAAFRAIRLAPRHAQNIAGLRVLKTALLLLTIGYWHYAPLFALASSGVVSPTLPYLTYGPFYDLILLVMLMFGMVMVLTGEVQHELEVAHADLAAAHEWLQERSRVDHLTSALKRDALHAVFSITSGRASGDLAGAAALADIDELKAINDQHGHAVGDAAIRAVATAIRQLIRADDLLFRWGGDEFLVLLIGVSESQARERLANLNDRLKQTPVGGGVAPIDVCVSVGFAPFDSAKSLDQVIALADEAMYSRKRRN